MTPTALTKTDIDQLSQRLSALGMHLDQERMVRAVAIVHAHGAHPDDISDMALLSICVEAYRHKERETLPIV
jgi:hypothetical protein